MGIAERRVREFERREAEILAAALALFDEDGWESVTVDQIALRAEVGKGTVYKHFASKHEIYARLALDFYTDVLDDLARVPVEGPADGALGKIIARAFRYHLARPEYRRVVRYCAREDFRQSLSAAWREAFETLDARFFAFMETLLRAGMSQGVFVERPITALVCCLHASFDGALAHLWGASPFVTDATPAPALAQGDGTLRIAVDDLIDEMCGFMLAGIGARGAPADASALGSQAESSALGRAGT